MGTCDLLASSMCIIIIMSLSLSLSFSSSFFSSFFFSNRSSLGLPGETMACKYKKLHTNPILHSTITTQNLTFLLLCAITHCSIMPAIALPGNKQWASGGRSVMVSLQGLGFLGTEFIQTTTTTTTTTNPSIQIGHAFRPPQEIFFVPNKQNSHSLRPSHSI